MIKLLIVGAGGFVGAIARYGVASLAQRWSLAGFPLGTFVVNIVGCLLIGALLGGVELRQSLSESARLFLTVGLLGAFTTFSTFSHETLQLVRAGDLRMAAFNVVVSVVLGLGAVALGRVLVRLPLAA